MLCLKQWHWWTCSPYVSTDGNSPFTYAAEARPASDNPTKPCTLGYTVNSTKNMGFT